MADLGVRPFLRARNADPTLGIRRLAPALKIISMRALMTSLRIIHISDLHFTKSAHTLGGLDGLIDSQNSQVRSNTIAQYLIDNKALLGTNIVVITGDLTDSGDKADYEIAKAFIQRLDANGFFVASVPGNHDYCWEGNLFFEDIFKAVSTLGDIGAQAIADAIKCQLDLIPSITLPSEAVDWLVT